MNKPLLSQTCGFVSFLLGSILIFRDVVSMGVLLNLGNTPSTGNYRLAILQSAALAIVLGIPCGYFSWKRSRSQFGLIGMILCLVPVLLLFYTMNFL